MSNQLCIGMDISFTMDLIETCHKKNLKSNRSEFPTLFAIPMDYIPIQALLSFDVTTSVLTNSGTNMKSSGE
jgi:hypothetical protein